MENFVNEGYKREEIKNQIKQVEKKAIKKNNYPGDQINTSNIPKDSINNYQLKTLKQKEVSNTEKINYFDRKKYPESQINKLKFIDQQIEDSKQQIKDTDYITDFASDFINADRTLRTQQRLEREEKEKKWMIKGN